MATLCIMALTNCFNAILLNFVPPQVLGGFANGRVEQFIPYRPLEPQELAQPRMASAIARRLAQLHTVRVPGDQHAQIFSKMFTW